MTLGGIVENIASLEAELAYRTFASPTARALSEGFLYELRAAVRLVSEERA